MACPRLANSHCSTMNTESAAASSIDFRVYYELEPYLFETVSRRFAQEGTLGAVDFFCIVIWKANRSKSKIARRLMLSGRYADLEAAVRSLTSAIAKASSSKDRFLILIRDWGFLLPTAFSDSDRALPQRIH